MTEDTSDPGLAFLGIPFDGLVTYRAGAQHGPAAIRQWSRLCRSYSLQMQVSVFERLRAFDAGDLDVSSLEYTEVFRRVEENVTRLQQRGVSVVSLGGDHSILLPILRATRQRYPGLTLIHFDAHSDTTDTSLNGERYHHGTWLRRALEEGLVDGRRVFQIGVRGWVGSEEYGGFPKQAGIRVLDVESLHAPSGRGAFLELLRATAGDSPCYLTFDIDAVDPAFAPGTGTPVPGGLSSAEVFTVLRSLRGLNVIGGDVVEVAPDYDTAGITALLGAAVATEIAALIALSPQSRPVPGRESPPAL